MTSDFAVCSMITKDIHSRALLTEEQRQSIFLCALRVSALKEPLFYRRNTNSAEDI